LKEFHANDVRRLDDDDARPRRYSARDDDDYYRRDDRLRDERRLDFDEQWDERLGQPPPPRSRERDDVDESARRHALTPREREHERRERRPDFDYSREAFRRGVDRLMDEPPSRRYRRWD
jgi:hypothetical protein